MACMPPSLVEALSEHQQSILLPSFLSPPIGHDGIVFTGHVPGRDRVDLLVLDPDIARGLAVLREHELAASLRGCCRLQV